MVQWILLLAPVWRDAEDGRAMLQRSVQRRVLAMTRCDPVVSTVTAVAASNQRMRRPYRGPVRGLPVQPRSGWPSSPASPPVRASHSRSRPGSRTLGRELAIPSPTPARRSVGPGELMLGALGGVQFVLLARTTWIHATPVFAGALFRTLHDRLGFRHLVVEQARSPSSPRSGRRARFVRNGWRRSPSATFPLRIRQATRIYRPCRRRCAGAWTGPRFWGVEQATGATRYREELVALRSGP